MMHRAFLRLDSASTEDMLTDAAVHVLAENGAAGLTSRSVADWLGVTPARVSQMVRREHLVAVAATRFANRWLDWIEYRRWIEGAASLLPSEIEEMAGVRVQPPRAGRRPLGARAPDRAARSDEHEGR
jgi:hypothetical protein